MKSLATLFSDTQQVLAEIKVNMIHKLSQRIVILIIHSEHFQKSFRKKKVVIEALEPSLFTPGDLVLGTFAKAFFFSFPP